MNRTILYLMLIAGLAFGTVVTHAAITTHTYYFDEPRVEIVNGQVTVILEGTTTWGKVGEPLLPHAPVQILLPPGEEAFSISVETADPVVLGEGYRIPHRQKPYPLSSGAPAEVTSPNLEVYSSDEAYPSQLSGALQTQFLSGHGIAYAVVFPVTYRPVSGTLAYYPWIQVKIESRSTAQAQQANAFMLKRTHATRDRLSGMVDNPEIITAYGPQSPSRNDSWDMLLITMADFVDDYQEFVDYKNRSGILTTVKTVEDIYANYSGIDNQDKIRNCIIDYYTNYDITYVFLCGDNEHIPCRGLWCQDDHLPADLYYAGLDGNWNDDGDDHWGEPGEDDLLAEVYIGRSCADSPAEIDHVINKSLMYQTEPVVDEVETALMVGEDLDWDIWAWEYKEEIRLGSSFWGYTTVGIPENVRVDTLYERPGIYWSAMTNLLPLLNLGPNLVNHLGHANEYYVMKFNLGSINDYNFTNDGINHNFFIGYSQGCYPGAFDAGSPDCILEAFTTIAHAAVAYVGNSRYGWGNYSTTNGPSQHFDRQFFDALFDEGITTLGWMNQDSKEDNAWMVVGDNIIRWCYYELNLFGDPTLDVWTAEPGVFRPSYSPVAQVGWQSFEVSNISVPGALVTISMNNEVLGRAEANASGIATVTFDELLIQPGELDVMITAHNMIPYQGRVDVVSPDGPFVIFSSYEIEDETTGNGNGQLDYSETVQLALTVENVGLGEATGVNLTISCDDPLMTITDSTEYLGDVGAGATGTVNGAFAIEISPDVENGHEFEFTLTATDGDSTWVSPFSIPAYAPIVVFDELVIEDQTGNSDNHLDPGETGDFHITLRNDGGSDAPDMVIAITCNESLITIPQDSLNLLLLAAGSEETIISSGIIADENIPQGTIVDFTLDISASGEYSCQQAFNITVGDVRYVPSGPDDYGYYAYDMYDGDGAPEFSWIEIAPIAGGPGTDLELGDTETVTVELPFSFKFYGNDYDRITVCSHGWMSFGTEPIFFPMNRPIPDGVPPNKMVAGIWDDLNPALGGQVCYYHDYENFRFVVEWYDVPHTANPGIEETFQIVLLDPTYYPTPTGDGEIVINYQTLSSMLDGCTVGIEDNSGTVGLQYLFNGEYDSVAMPLEDGLAIKFKTAEEIVGVEPVAGKTIPTEFSLGQNYPNPFNPATTLSFSLPKAGRVSLVIYDIQGRAVARLVDGWRQAGIYRVAFDASDLASGVYIYRFKAGEFNGCGKMVLVK